MRPEELEVSPAGKVRRPRLPKGSGAALRTEILAAAEEIFVTDGYEGASIRKIAASVGVSSTALYIHFRDKGEMLSEIAAHSIGDLVTRMEALAAEPSTAADQVRSMIRAYMDFAMGHPNAYQLVFGQQIHLSEAQLAHLDDLGQRCFAPFLAAVRRLFEVGGVRAASPEIAAQVAWGAAHGLTSLQLTKPRFPWADEPVVLCEAALDALFDGLFSGSEPSLGMGEGAPTAPG